MREYQPEPYEVVEMVERYVDKELDDARKFDNREPLDDSGVYSLHLLAAAIYAKGALDGERAASERERRRNQRDFDRKAKP